MNGKKREKREGEGERGRGIGREGEGRSGRGGEGRGGEERGGELHTDGSQVMLRNSLSFALSFGKMTVVDLKLEDTAVQEGKARTH